MRLDLPPAANLQVSNEFPEQNLSQARKLLPRFWTWDGAEQCFLKAEYLTTVPVDNHISGTKDCSMGKGNNEFE